MTNKRYKNMKKVNAVISRSSDGFYGVHCFDEMFSGGGNSAEEAKADMLEQMKFFKETAIEEGFEYPDFLDEEFEIVYSFDVKSVLEYYSGILSLAGLERVTGIHQKQLWSYLHGKSTPRKAQVDKIEAGLHNLGKELMSVSL